MGAALSRLLPERNSLSLASLPENVLAEIFVRLPAHPAFLRCITLTCKQFREIVVSPVFLRQFRAHHGGVPPLVGFIRNQSPRFIPTGGNGIIHCDSERVVAGAGVLEPCDADWIILSCRHGRVLLQSRDRCRLLVVDPMAGRRQYIDAPSWYRPHYSSAAVVICSPGHGGHGDCRSMPFRIVFVYFPVPFMTDISIYSSETNQWVKVQSKVTWSLPKPIDTSRPSVLVGNILHWFTIFNTILCFNVDTKEQHEIPLPPGIHFERREVRLNTILVATRDRCLGILSIMGRYVHLWASGFSDGFDLQWTPRWLVTLGALFPLPEDTAQAAKRTRIRIIGHDEDDGVAYIWTVVGVFAIQLETMESNKVFGNYQWMHRLYPYRSFFLAAGTSSSGSILCST